MPFMQDPDSGCIVVALGSGDILIGGQGGGGLGTLFFKQGEPREIGTGDPSLEGKSINDLNPELMVMFGSKRGGAAAIAHMINVLKGIAEHIDDPIGDEPREA
jgi:hypothetical protein